MGIIVSRHVAAGAVKAVGIDSSTFRLAADANGWNRTITAAGKTVWTKSVLVTGITLTAGLSFNNGNVTSMPVGLTADDLYSGSYILTDSLTVDGSSRHVIPHTIFTAGSGVTIISFGIVNTFTGGTWTGSLLCKYRIEQA